jgi:hypothetical protein
VNCGPGHIQCNYCSSYSGFNIQLNLSALRLEICRHLDARYTANLVPYLTHHPVYPMWTMIPATCNVIIAPNIQALIFNWICLRGYWRYVDNSMLLILQTWCQIQLTTARLRYVNCCPGHIQCNYSSAYSGFNIQLNVSALLLVTRRHFDAHCTANWVPNIAHVLQFTLCELWSRTCNNVVTSPHIKASVCNWTYLPCYCTYLDNSMLVIL